MSERTMTLRTKLLAAFAGLAMIALLVMGVALYTTLRWQSANQEVETHFRRSLLLQSVRAHTFQALKEVDDALTGDHVDARGDFERALRPASRDFEIWASLADTPDERAEVARVRGAHERLVGSGRRVFAVAGTDRAEAIRLADDEVDTKDFTLFQQITEQAVLADRAKRREISAVTERVRLTAQVMLAISAISILSLMLLIAAYLSHDLFQPLRALGETLDRLGRGDWKARADGDRGDEIGEVARAVNRVAEAAHVRGLEASPAQQAATGTQGDASEAYRLAAGLQARLAALRAGAGEADWAGAEAMAGALARSAALRAPVDLDLAQVALPLLVHRVIETHRAILSSRAISVEMQFAPDIGPVLGDAAKLCEALGEAVLRALRALPPRGGRLGLRAYEELEAGEARIEVADDGAGGDADLIERALQNADEGNAILTEPGLLLARTIIERHGGALRIFSEAGRGTVVQFSLPLRR